MTEISCVNVGEPCQMLILPMVDDVLTRSKINIYQEKDPIIPFASI